jgi:hypothetical protein
MTPESFITKSMTPMRKKPQASRKKCAGLEPVLLARIEIVNKYVDEQPEIACAIL